MPETPEKFALTKVTINIYSTDLKWLKARFGYGYSEIIRRFIRKCRRQIEDQEDAS